MLPDQAIRCRMNGVTHINAKWRPICRLFLPCAQVTPLNQLLKFLKKLHYAKRFISCSTASALAFWWADGEVVRRMKQLRFEISRSYWCQVGGKLCSIISGDSTASMFDANMDKKTEAEVLNSRQQRCCTVTKPFAAPFVWRRLARRLGWEPGGLRHCGWFSC